MNHVSVVILCVGAVALAGCLAWPKAGVVRTWTPSPQTAVVYSGATAEAIASTVTARPTVTRAVPISTPTPRPSPSPMPSPTNDPHRIMITEVDIEQAMASGTGSGESYVVQGLDVRFSNGKMRLKADQLTYGAFSVKSLDLVGRLVANSGQLQLIAESVTPGGLVGALIPRVANQALAQYASQWYVETVAIHDGSIELRIARCGYERGVWMGEDKLRDLVGVLQGMGKVVVAFSGGVDSSLLLRVAHGSLGEGVLAVTAVSPSLPPHQLEMAHEVARLVGANHVLIETHEVEDEHYAANPPDRCYFCHSITLDQLIPYARSRGYDTIVDGNNADDLGDFRPGRRAALERGVRSPLQEVGLAKAEIRALARGFGLPNWDMPSAACLSSRVPYGSQITPEILRKVDQAEQVLRRMGIRQVRVRHDERVARIEVEPGDFATVIAARQEIVGSLQALGYAYVTLDLAGFRSGSLNEVISTTGKYTVYNGR